MTGQGRPPRSLVACRIVGLVQASCRALLAGVLVLAAAGFVRGEETWKLRVTWGGTSAKAWQVTVALSEGTIRAWQPLGIEADAPGSAYRDEAGAIRLRQRSPRSFDGIEFECDAPATARLTVELADPSARAAGGEPQPPERFEFNLSDVANAPVTRAYDGGANRLTVRRAPGDGLRVAFERPSLVFATGESFDFDVLPQVGNLPAGATVQLQIKLQAARGGAEVWRTQLDTKVGPDGGLPKLGPVRVPLPAQEGVYDVVLSLVRWQFRAPLFPSTTLAERKVQVIALDPRPATPPPPAALEWRTLAEIDPTSQAWWKRLPQFSQGTLGNQKSEPATIDNLKCLQLAPGGWQAYPLTVEQAGAPHALEIDFPGGWPQSLGVSVVEPNAAGKVLPIGLDSGIDVEEPFPGAPLPPPLKAARVLGESETRQSHRVLFWPRTTQPWVLLTNRRTDGPAAFATIRVLAGGPQLPAAPLEADRSAQRLVAASFDRPLFSENFSASEAFDEASQRTLDDWVTFHDGARRWIQYLKHAGYNGAVLPVLSEGSTLYPSERLEPTPRHDSGAFFASGQDPVRKDVVEMLLRMFDREGLRLVPALQFAAPLPALEAALRQSPPPEGIALLGPDGRPWVERMGTQRGLAPYYNVLDPRVQQAMLDVADEFVTRYGQHPSFAGLALQHGPDTYAQLPGQEWGSDEATLQRFATASRLTLPSAARDGHAALAEALQVTHRQAWLDWRTGELAAWHRKLAQRIASAQPQAKLYLDLTEWTKTSAAQRALRPALPPRDLVAEALREAGFQPARYADDQAIVLLRPRRLGPAASWSAQGANQALASAASDDHWGPPAARRGTAIYFDPQSLLLPAFDAVSPFGAENTFTWQFSTLTPTGAARRRALVQSLAEADQPVVWEGGRLLPMGQERETADLLQTLRRLPAARFQTVTLAAPGAGPAAAEQPAIVRTLTFDGRTYLYALNNSPWEIGLQLGLDAPAGCRVESLGARRLEPLTPGPGGLVLCRARLAPYDLWAIALGVPGVQVRSTEVAVAPAVTAALQTRIQELGARLDHLRALPPNRLVTNPGFEALPGGAPGVPGWIHAQNPQIAIALEPLQKHGGTTALKVENRGPGAAWVRSDVFPPPATGRLAYAVWVLAEAEPPPTLRLAIEGRHNGATYYKFATVGAGGKGVPLNTEWTPYLFQLNDLPTTGLTDLRVGFDLMGPGRVWIDDLEIRELAFDENERAELSKTIALANFQLGQGRIGDCQQTLSGYWPQFLWRHVPAPAPARVARQPNPSGGRFPAPPLDGPMLNPPLDPAQPPAPAAPMEPPAPTVLERLRSWVPTWGR